MSPTILPMLLELRRAPTSWAKARFRTGAMPTDGRGPATFGSAAR